MATAMLSCCLLPPGSSLMNLPSSFSLWPFKRPVPAGHVDQSALTAGQLQVLSNVLKPEGHWRSCGQCRVPWQRVACMDKA